MSRRDTVDYIVEEMAWENPRRMQVNDDNPQEVIIRGRLTVHAKHGTIVKEQFGSSAVKRSNGNITSLGDDLKAATSDALKKCASLLGLALDLYES